MSLRLFHRAEALWAPGLGGGQSSIVPDQIGSCDAIGSGTEVGDSFTGIAAGKTIHPEMSTVYVPGTASGATLTGPAGHYEIPAASPMTFFFYGYYNTSPWDNAFNFNSGDIGVGVYRQASQLDHNFARGNQAVRTTSEPWAKWQTLIGTHVGGTGNAKIYVNGNWEATASITADAACIDLLVPESTPESNTYIGILGLWSREWTEEECSTYGHNPRRLLEDLRRFQRRRSRRTVRASTTPPSTVTGTAAQVLPNLEQSAAGTHSAPVFTGTAAQVLPAVTQAAVGTHSVPVFTATASHTLPNLEQAAAGTHIVPVFTATASQTLPNLEQAAAGTHSVPVFTATAAQVLPAITQAVAGTFSVPVFTGTAAQVLPNLEQSAAGTHTAPVGTVLGTAAQTLPAIEQTAAGTSAVPVFTATAAQALPALTQSVVATFDAGTFTGTADQVLPGTTQTVVGTHSVPVATGTAAQSLPAVTQSGVGSFWTNLATAVTQALPAVTQAAAGTFTQATTVTSPGIEYRLPLGRIHFVLPVDRHHATLPVDRHHATLPED